MGACFAVLSGAWLSDLELVIGCKSNIYISHIRSFSFDMKSMFIILMCLRSRNRLNIYLWLIVPEDVNSS